MVTLKLQRYFVIYKRSPLKMQKIKNFHKSKVDGLKKLSTRACLFNVFLHFKGCSFINHKISLQFERYHDHFFDFS